MSDTPRTDAEEAKQADEYYTKWMVDASFARILERELAAAEALLVDIRPFTDYLPTWSAAVDVYLAQRIAASLPNPQASDDEIYADDPLP